MNISVEFYIVIALLCGLICYFFAKEKNLNPFLWFGIGVVFSVLAIAIVSAVKKKIKK